MLKINILLFILIILFSGCIQTEAADEPTEIPEPEVIEEPLREIVSVKNYELDLTIKSVPSEYSELGEYLPKYGEVFGIPFFASERVPDNKLLHGMNIMAQYLDNDEDGIPDNPSVVDELVEERVGIMMFKNDNEGDSLGIWESDLPLDKFQELYADETIISGSQFDASLEEILHLITQIGYGGVYPSVFGEFSGSHLANLMDNARGGHFENEGTFREDGETFQLAVPSSYPASAWYTYDDETCEYDCMNTEYIYWALTSILEAQKDRCGKISHEWKLCTKEKVISQDPGIYELLTDPQYSLPTILPDGTYGN